MDPGRPRHSHGTEDEFFDEIRKASARELGHGARSPRERYRVIEEPFSRGTIGGHRQNMSEREPPIVTGPIIEEDATRGLRVRAELSEPVEATHFGIQVEDSSLPEYESDRSRDRLRYRRDVERSVRIDWHPVLNVGVAKSGYLQDRGIMDDCDRQTRNPGLDTKRVERLDQPRDVRFLSTFTTGPESGRQANQKRARSYPEYCSVLILSSIPLNVVISDTTVCLT